MNAFSQSRDQELLESRILELDQAIELAKEWLAYEGVIDILPIGLSIMVVTSCNPAAITAPIPSSYLGFDVNFHQKS